MRSLALMGMWSAMVLPAAAREVTVEGHVFLDKNGNGLRDAGENSLGGMLVSDGETIVRCDGQGAYRLTFDVTESRFVILVQSTGYRPTSSFARRIDPADETTAYRVDFGLQPDDKSRREEFTFLATADSQFTAEGQAKLLREEFTQITQTAAEPAFFFSVGDLTMNGTVQEFAWYRFALEPFTIPVFHIFGGHDGNYARKDGHPGSVANYERELNAPPYYAWQYGGVHFVVFVREMPYLSSAAQKRQAKWLDAYFEAIPAGSRVITAAHYPATPDQFDRWSKRHKMLGHFYGHWHGDGIAYYKKIPLVLTGPIRGLDWGVFSRTYRVCRVKGETLTTELRVTGQEQRIEIISPAADRTVSRQESLPIQVLAYDTPTWVRSATCRLSGPTGEEETIVLKQHGQWTWRADWNAAGKEMGSYKIEANVVNRAGQTWGTRQRFRLEAGRPPRVAVEADWPSGVKDPRTGRRAGPALRVPLRLAWVTHTSGRNMIGAGPIVAGGRVYTAVQNHDLSAPFVGVACYEAAGGKLIWRARTDGSVAGCPTARNGRIYALSTIGTVYCLSADDGREIWHRVLYDAQATHRVCRAELAATDDHVVALLTDGPLAVLDAETGREIHRLKVANDGYCSGPNVVDGNIYTTSQYDVTATGLGDGKTAWRTKVSRVRGVSTPVVYDGVLCHNGARVRAFDAASGRMLWEQSADSGARCVGLPVVDGDLVFVGGRTMAALNKKTGQRVWSFRLGQDQQRFANNKRQVMGGGSSPIVAGEALIFGGDDGYLYALDKNNGKLVWRYWLGVPIKTSPAASGNALFVTDYDGNLYAFVSDETG